MAYEDDNKHPNRDANRDPITDQPGAHPATTGLGAAVGGIVGIATAASAAAGGGVVLGPVGAVVGAAVGAVAGGLIGSEVGEAVNPTEEDEYWRSTYDQEPYVEPGSTYDRYAGAYRTGYLGRSRISDRSFEAAEGDLRADYYAHRGDSDLEWEDVREAARASWARIDQRSSS